MCILFKYFSTTSDYNSFCQQKAMEINILDRQGKTASQENN